MSHVNVLTYNPIIEYWNKIESGEEVVSQKVRKVYKHLVKDSAVMKLSSLLRRKNFALNSILKRY